MLSAEIRRRWLGYFEERDHTVVESAPLIADDPTLLLVNAGMVPFKPYFLGEATPPFPRATSVQKCVRTVDIEDVGKTTRHGSFFQMCGNFSFGDYFKEKAIPLAWELLTKPVAEGGYGLPESRLWITIYLDDDEAEDIWRRVVGVPAERIQRLGMEENFWSMGVPGPCGPCSEICYDRGPEYGPDGGPEASEERYLELWNLVFMQYIRGEGPAKKDYPILGELPKKNIDTGLGLERLAMLLQGVDNLYEIDTSRPILDRAGELTGSRYGADPKDDVSLRVVADHVRTAVMLIGDGVTPANEGRGYVLRRIMRRAIRNARLLGATEPAMHELVATTIEVMRPQYPELDTDRGRIDAIAVAEETSFLQTLRTGTQIFDTAAAETKRRGAATLAGEQAFTLHDTYGFPIDLTLEMAAEQGLSVDEEGFRRLMAEQRLRGKEDAQRRKAGATDPGVYREVRDSFGGAVFTGYEELAGEARIVGLLVGGASVPAASAGEAVEVVLDRTPFYAEGGGQLADHGLIRLDSGAELEVFDVQQPLPGLIVHRAKVRRGEAHLDAAAYAEIDVERRRAISRSHSATHMVHAGFRRALGESAAQAGSENSPGRFRFDFTAPGAVPPSVLQDVEEEVNAALAENLEVHDFSTSLQQARALGALAMFGEKYGDQVRVVEIGDYSRELCGGTHVHRSGQLGVIKLLGESSIGAGVRRVDALVGIDAFRFLAKESVLVSQLSEQLKTRPEELPDRAAQLVVRLREAERELERLRSAQVLQAAAGLAANPTDVHGVAVVTHHVSDGASVDELRKLVSDVRERLQGRPAVVAITGLATNDRPVIVVTTNEAARERGIKAGEIVRVAAKTLGGGGGGRDDLAQGGGSDGLAVPEALQEVQRAVADRVRA
ncbi:MAG: alanine--tRNA ligase [Streptosporangiales bacterium]|nr:alanine--tRNA ligase [Streptosporangiales bacterium]